MTPDKPGKRNDGAADPDASDLDGLIAERDPCARRAGADPPGETGGGDRAGDPQGAVELAGIRAGRRPGQPGQ